MRAVTTTEETMIKNRWPSARIVVLCLAAALFIAICGLPAIYMFGILFAGDDGGLSFENCRFYPLAMLATEAAARSVAARLEEAALLVAAPRLVAMKITLPLIAPAVAAAALVVFVLAVSEFGVPGLLRVNGFTTEVFTAALALMQAMIALVPLALLAWFLRREGA